MVARTVAACSPPMTEILELGHMYKNRGLGEEQKKKINKIKEASAYRRHHRRVANKARIKGRERKN